MSALHRFLEGIKVLDLSHYLPGPIASLLLADMGARVIKVVPPAGDGMCKLGPRGADGSAIFYEALNAQKSELTLDLKDSRDNAVLRDLAAVADVLIEGFRPGTLARLGLNPTALRQRNEQLVICSISGYGASGPLAQSAGHDANYLASSGLMSRNADGFFDPPFADSVGALFAAIAILGALHKRCVTGRGCTIDVGLADTVMPMQLYQLASFGATEWMPEPSTYYLNGGVASYHDYRTSDNHRIVLAALETKFWRAFCSAAGRTDWIERHSDPEPQTALIQELTQYFLSMPLDECLGLFAGVDCCLTPVLNLRQALASPQTLARGLVVRTSGSLQALFPAYVNEIAPESRAPLRRISAADAKSAFGSE